MRMLMPKFMENKEWYYYDKNNEYYLTYECACPMLTDKAPKEAVESYLMFCESIFDYGLGFVPEFVYEEYRKHMARFE